MRLRIVDPADGASPFSPELDDDDLADHLLGRLEPALIGPPRWLRLVLAVVATLQLAVAVPWLFGSDPLGLLGDASASHLTRDGALGLVVGVAGLLTAWRPRYAMPAVVVGLVVVGAQVTTALVDDHFHRVTLLVEATHVTTVVITALVGLASRPLRPLPSASSGNTASPGNTASSVNPASPDAIRAVPDRADD